MMRDAILSIKEQLAFAPTIQNKEQLAEARSFIVAGMGGSGLAGDILQRVLPSGTVIVHKDYGLSTLDEGLLRESLIITNSYSGNTEETVNVFDEAIRRGYMVSAVASGGALLQRAGENLLPHIILPETNIQPRNAVGYQLRAVMALAGLDAELAASAKAATVINPVAYEERGKQIAGAIRDTTPVIYASRRNQAVAYNWKIKFNETGKIPAFYNVFPEVNHNEIEAYNVKSTTQKLSERLSFVFIYDDEDHQRVIRRMETMESLLRDKSFRVMSANMEGSSIYEKVFNSLALADFSALYTAESYGLDSEEVPLIEDFKRRISS